MSPIIDKITIYLFLGKFSKGSKIYTDLDISSLLD